MAHHDNGDREEDPVAGQYMLTQQKYIKRVWKDLQQCWISMYGLYHCVCHDGHNINMSKADAY